MQAVTTWIVLLAPIQRMIDRVTYLYVVRAHHLPLG